MSHLNMTIKLAQRLANRKADKAYKNYRESSPDFGTNSRGKRLTWFNSTDAIAEVWRFTGYAHDLIRMNNTGYYADNYQEEVCRGIVAQLPARSGECLYLAGYEMSESDATCLYADIYSDKEDAARAADSIAERIAEDNREYLAKDAAEIQIAELKETEKATLEEIHELHAEWITVSACGHLTAANVIRQRVRDNISEIKANRKRIAKLEDNYWEAVPN